MARDYIRPELSGYQGLLADLVPDSTRILINPDWNDLRQALAAVQKGCRKNRLLEVQLKRLYEQSREPGFFSAWIGSADEVPIRYNFDFPHTQAAACWLGEDLTGFLIQRTKTPPFTEISPPIYALTIADEDYDPQKRFEDVCQIFWTRLSDEEIARLRNYAVLNHILIYDRRKWSEDRAWRERMLKRLRRKPLPPETLARRWKTLHEKWEREWQEYRRRWAKCEEEQARARLLREQELQQMFVQLLHGVEPGYVSRLKDACMTVVETIGQEGKDAIAWREFKQRWPAIATKYERYFIQRIENGQLTPKSLSAIHDAPVFTLSLDVWDGGQRLFDSPQLVFRINAENVYYSFAHSSTAAMKAINEALFENASPGHPSDRWSVGWLRIHVDEENGIVFVDEVQSDALEVLRMTKKDLDGKAIAEIEKVLRSWNLHGFASVRQWAQAINCRAAIHSKTSLCAKPGATTSDRKWNTYYKSIIKAFGLREETVPGYPAPIMVEPASKEVESPGASEA